MRRGSVASASPFVRSATRQPLRGGLDPERSTEGRSELEQVTASPAQSALDLEPFERIVVLHGHENRHHSSAGGHLEPLADLDPTKDSGSVLLQGPHPDSFHVRRCSTSPVLPSSSHSAHPAVIGT